MDLKCFEWVREPKHWSMTKDSLEIITEPNTDLWQRTYYHFQHDNGPCFQMKSKEQYFSFTVKATSIGERKLFDQCGIILYLDSENWLKASSEYDDSKQQLGSVVTNHGFSDWATRDIPADIDTIYYRLSRRKADYKIESSFDGINFEQMRITHLYRGDAMIKFGVYACSPSNSSFKARFSEFRLEDCLWKEHQDC